MHIDKRICSAPSDQTKRLDKAIINHLLSLDQPWRLSALQKTLGHPMPLILASVERLAADGLVVRNGESVRASRAAVRADELIL